MAVFIGARRGRVVVLGGGVIGLTCGNLLQEAGFAVTIWAAALSPRTTSDVAAAFWYPFHVYPISQASAWGELTYKTLTQLAGQPGTGVFMAPATILFEESTARPSWAQYVPDFDQGWPPDLPDGYLESYEFSTPIVEMPLYLRYLANRFQRAGGVIVQRHVLSLQEVLAENPVVVNCTGLGARSLVGDLRLFPIRGQVVRVDRPTGQPYVLLAEGTRTGLVYVVYRSRDVIVGGSVEEHNWSLVPDPLQTQQLLAGAVKLAPEIAGANMSGVQVGLRPGRDEVRLEAEVVDEGVIVHCYGHGGGGVSLSWGSAQVVLKLVVDHAEAFVGSPLLTGRRSAA